MKEAASLLLLNHQHTNFFKHSKNNRAVIELQRIKDEHVQLARAVILLTRTQPKSRSHAKYQNREHSTNPEQILLCCREHKTNKKQTRAEEWEIKNSISPLFHSKGKWRESQTAVNLPPFRWRRTVTPQSPHRHKAPPETAGRSGSWTTLSGTSGGHSTPSHTSSLCFVHTRQETESARRGMNFATSLSRLCCRIASHPSPNAPFAIALV